MQCKAINASSYLGHLWALILVHGIVAQQTCLDLMLQQGPPEGWLKSITAKSRKMPDVRHTDLSASDWQGPVSWNPEASTLGQSQKFAAGQVSSSDGPPEDLCRKDRGVLRYKVWRGVVYAWADDHHKKYGTDRTFVEYRNAFVEQLLGAMYLYDGFPDEVDLFFTPWDNPGVCKDMHVPFLQHTIIQPRPTSAWVTPGYIPHSLIHSATGLEKANDVVSYMHGFAISVPTIWRDMSVSSEQLHAYSACTLARCCTPEARAAAELHASATTKLCASGKGPESPAVAHQLAGSVLAALKAARNSSVTGMRSHVSRLLSRAAQCRRAHGVDAMQARMKRGGTRQRQLAAAISSPVQSMRHEEEAHTLGLVQRIPRAFWRGSNTGNYRGWAPDVLASMHDGALGTELLNKRTYAALLSLTHPWLDVGLSMYLNGPKCTCTVTRLGTSSSTGLPELSELLARNATSMDLWSSYALTLSIDGFGTPWRLAQQYLSLTPVVKMESPLEDFTSRRFLPGVHYEPVSYNLSDLAPRTLQLLHEVRTNSTRLEGMAQAAQALAAEAFSFTGQLDTFMWAVLKVKQACNWRVRSPLPADGKAAPVTVSIQLADLEKPPKTRPAKAAWQRVLIPRNYVWQSKTLAALATQLRSTMPANFQH